MASARQMSHYYLLTGVKVLERSNTIQRVALLQDVRRLDGGTPSTAAASQLQVASRTHQVGWVPRVDRRRSRVDDVGEVCAQGLLRRPRLHPSIASPVCLLIPAADLEDHACCDVSKHAPSVPSQAESRTVR